MTCDMCNHTISGTAIRIHGRVLCDQTCLVRHLSLRKRLMRYELRTAKRLAQAGDQAAARRAVELQLALMTAAERNRRYRAGTLPRVA